MKTSIRPLSFVLAVGVATASSLAFATSANAASNYDQVIKPTEALILSDGAGCTIDLSASWADEVAKHLGAQDLESFTTREAWSVGSWWHDSTDTSKIDTITLQWWEPNDLPAVATFSQDSALHAPGGRTALITKSWDRCDIQVNVEPVESDWYPAMALHWGNGEYAIRPFLAKGVDINYPIGYEGEYIPSEYIPSTDTPPIEEPPVEEPSVEEPPTEEPPAEEPYDPGPPAPITRTYNGTVDCGYKDLHGMAVVQDGVTSAVTLYNWESQYRASWQHNLVVGVPYQVVVTCGGSLTYSNGSVDPEVASGDWMCKPGSTPFRSKAKLPFGLQNKMMIRIPGNCYLS